MKSEKEIKEEIREWEDKHRDKSCKDFYGKECYVCHKIGILKWILED